MPNSKETPPSAPLRPGAYEADVDVLTMQDGTIVIQFAGPVERIAMSPESAIKLAQAILEAADVPITFIHDPDEA